MNQQKSSTTKSKNTIMKFLPKATSSVSFQNPPIYSPASNEKRLSEKTHKSNLGRIGFSGPMVSMIPGDTRRKIKNNSDYTIVYEPTSPRVSCMGQVKCKYQKDKLQQRLGNKPPTDKVLQLIAAKTHNTADDQQKESKSETKNKKILGFKKIFNVVTPGSSRRKQNSENKISKAPLYIENVPTLSTMKRFSSGRDKFSGIDWTKEIKRYDSDEEESDNERVIVPSSAPVVIRNSLGFDDKFIRVAGINKEPKKEINLWKRRTMPQPKPLQVHI